MVIQRTYTLQLGKLNQKKTVLELFSDLSIKSNSKILKVT